jgi:hypothetical protein
MGFSDSLQRFAAKTEQRARAVHQATAVAVKQSWVEGSPITGAPPLPIATGNAPTVGQLRRGVKLTYPDPDTALIYTTVPYAAEVEDNPRGVTFTEGGAHGFKQTVAGFPRIVEAVTTRIVGGAP